MEVDIENTLSFTFAPPKMEYIEISAKEFADKITTYTANLDKLFAEVQPLEKVIKEKLGELKYEEN